MTRPAPRILDAFADQYPIDRELGKGGMATVYVAHDVKHGRDVALKVFDELLEDPEGAGRFLREIRLTARLEHMNIVPLYDSGEADGLLFYVMRLLPGDSLRKCLAHEGQQPVPAAVKIASECANALAYAHSCGVIHRDIKPENILLEGNRPLLADFGIAQALGLDRVERFTRTGAVHGTPAYMSPEQLSDAPGIDARADIYSLGCVLFEMLTGRTPFVAASVYELIRAVHEDSIPRLDAFRADVPESVQYALDRALAKDPGDRFSNATDFAQALLV